MDRHGYEDQSLHFSVISVPRYHRSFRSVCILLTVDRNTYPSLLTAICYFHPHSLTKKVKETIIQQFPSILYLSIYSQDLYVDSQTKIGKKISTRWYSPGICWCKQWLKWCIYSLSREHHWQYKAVIYQCFFTCTHDENVLFSEANPRCFPILEIRSGNNNDVAHNVFNEDFSVFVLFSSRGLGEWGGYSVDERQPEKVLVEGAAPPTPPASEGFLWPVAPGRKNSSCTVLPPRSGDFISSVSLSCALPE